ncbi:MAG: M67 family metallopeptidase [Thermoplasmata archaeon]|uniref:M67 family metallopeptidase n=1 Tax=Candidatus Sysuiplasma superficiale TaxID=2823368 RepID=A0A8J8CCA1_9ARCH|nr:M67 family metallopeptidase [Candidatus Sysuiplasma superficiale]MBX8643345.1 M67 family metallopeptidase [Candidatus Sysuiplasma superficiale]MCL4347225.1 M67 family metallopeptidase [Candidatus Thermoplasmatota archaeon]
MQSSILKEIIVHASETYPEECCGFLIGTEDAKRGIRTVSDAVRAVNAAANSKRTRYTIEPREILKMEQSVHSAGKKILGYYHSHPDHPPVPSEFDRNNAWPGYSYFIISVMNGSPAGMRSWRLSDSGKFIQEELSDGTQL